MTVYRSSPTRPGGMEEEMGGGCQAPRCLPSIRNL